MIRILSQRPQRVMPHKPLSVVEAVAQAFGVTEAEVLGVARVKHIVLARRAAMLILRNGGVSFPKIGERLGARNHSTIQEGVRRALHLHDYDPDWREKYDRAVQLLAAPLPREATDAPRSAATAPGPSSLRPGATLSQQQEK